MPNRDFRAVDAPTLFIEAVGTRYAYRRFGPRGGVPLLLIQRFQATLDDWDPQLLEILSDRRDVILFDNAGIGRSTGVTADSFAGIAQAAGRFVDALGIAQIDVMGWSMAGFMASNMALERPDLVRRLVLASSGPGHMPDAPPVHATPGRISSTDGAHDEDYLFLFFPNTEEGRTAGRAHLARLRLRADRDLEPHRRASLDAQICARATVMTPEGSLLHRFPQISIPVLVAHGRDDIRIPAALGYAAAQAMPDAKFIVYPAAGHAFLFQRDEEFGQDMLSFLAD